MSFFYLLKENGFEWDKAKKIFYGLTDPQILWLNEVTKKENQRLQDEAEDRSNENKFGTGTNKKSFNLRG
jgi:hypothetical protein